MSKVSTFRNSKSLLGEFSHLQASQAAASLTAEIYRMRSASVGKGVRLVKELAGAAEEIAVKIAQRPVGTTLLRISSIIADARLALAEFEARLLIARSLGYVGDDQLRRLDAVLRYLRLYCTASDDLAVDRVPRFTPNA
jgi:hypothetical protein